jgi:hypothetical protein
MEVSASAVYNASSVFSPKDPISVTLPVALLERLAPFVEQQFRCLAQMPSPHETNQWQEKWKATRCCLTVSNPLIEQLDAIFEKQPTEKVERDRQLILLKGHWADSLPPIMSTFQSINCLFVLSELVEMRARTEQFALAAESSQNPCPEIEKRAKELRLTFSHLMPFLAPSLAGLSPIAKAVYVPGVVDREAVAVLRADLVNRFNQSYLPWRKRKSLSEEAASADQRMKTIKGLMEGVASQAYEVESLRNTQKQVYNLTGQTYTNYIEELRIRLKRATDFFNECVRQKQNCPPLPELGAPTVADTERELDHYLVLDLDQRADLLKQIMLSLEALHVLRKYQQQKSLELWNPMIERGKQLAALLDELTDVSTSGRFSRLPLHGTSVAPWGGYCNQYTTLWNS